MFGYLSIDCNIDCWLDNIQWEMFLKIKDDIIPQNYGNDGGV